MRRTDFLKALGLGLASTTMIGDLKIEGMSIDSGIEKITVKDPNKAKLAIDLAAISNVGIRHDGHEMTAKDMLELYNQTGVLLYRRTQSMGENYQPITLIKE